MEREELRVTNDENDSNTTQWNNKHGSGAREVDSDRS